MSFLTDILTSTKNLVEERRRDRPLGDLLRDVSVGSDERRFLRALQQPGMSIIAEFKRRSPTSGELGDGLESYIRAYERGHARAVSVLTESTQFRGSLADLRHARRLTSLPLLCKDFVIDEYQIYEAADAGADAVLLIVTALSEEGADLKNLYECARKIGLDVLVEVRSEDELQAALDAQADIVGINNRDLKSFDIDRGKTSELLAHIPETVTVVSESGMRTVADVQSIAEESVSAALIGSALMKAAEPDAACLAFSSVDVGTKGLMTRTAA